MSGAIGPTLLLLLGLGAPAGWAVLTYLERGQAAELALALAAGAVSLGIFLQASQLKRLESVAERLERRLSREAAFLPPIAAAQPKPPPPAAAGKPSSASSASSAAKGRTADSPPSALPPPSPEPAGQDYGIYEERRRENVPPPFPPNPPPADGYTGFGERAAAQHGRRLEPGVLAAAWNDFMINGNGVFDAKGLAAALSAAGLEAEVRPPDNFVGLGTPLLAVLERGQRERVFLLPDFTRLAKGFVQWFELDPSMAAAARIQSLARPAELKRSGDGYQLAVKGRLE